MSSLTIFVHWSAAGLQGKPLAHEDVQEAAAKVGADFRKLIAETISEF